MCGNYNHNRRTCKEPAKLSSILYLLLKDSSKIIFLVSCLFVVRYIVYCFNNCKLIFDCSYIADNLESCISFSDTIESRLLIICLTARKYVQKI